MVLLASVSGMQAAEGSGRRSFPSLCMAWCQGVHYWRDRHGMQVEHSGIPGTSLSLSSLLFQHPKHFILSGDCYSTLCFPSQSRLPVYMTWVSWFSWADLFPLLAVLSLPSGVLPRTWGSRQAGRPLCEPRHFSLPAPRTIHNNGAEQQEAATTLLLPSCQAGGGFPALCNKP